MLGDGTLLLAQQGLLVWSRQEALAGVRSALFLDLPARREGAEAAVEGGAAASASLAERVRTQLARAELEIKVRAQA